jgi:hypothetical protein
MSGDELMKWHLPIVPSCYWLGARPLAIAWHKALARGIRKMRAIIRSYVKRENKILTPILCKPGQYDPRPKNNQQNPNVMMNNPDLNDVLKGHEFGL